MEKQDEGREAYQKQHKLKEPVGGIGQTTRGLSCYEMCAKVNGFEEARQISGQDQKAQDGCEPWIHDGRQQDDARQQKEEPALRKHHDNTVSHLASKNGAPAILVPANGVLICVALFAENRGTAADDRLPAVGAPNRFPGHVHHPLYH